MKSYINIRLILVIILFKYLPGVAICQNEMTQRKEDASDSRAILGCSVYSGVMAWIGLANKTEEAKSKAYNFGMAYSLVFQYWLFVTNDIDMRKKGNKMVSSYEKSMKRLIKTIKISDEARHYPLVDKSTIDKLDGTWDLSSVVLLSSTPYFPDGVKTIESYDNLIGEFLKWIDAEGDLFSK